MDTEHLRVRFCVFPLMPCVGYDRDDGCRRHSWVPGGYAGMRRGRTKGVNDEHTTIALSGGAGCASVGG